jgi:putative PIN family toxin of toxin-antitoxin system
MKVMIDTNVFMSALMFPASVPAQAMMAAASQHELILCEYIINELFEKVSEKRPDLMPALKVLLDTLAYKTAFPSGKTVEGLSDPDDVPILDAALSGDVDVLVSGDRHFLSLDLAQPKTMSPAEFIATQL